MKQHLLTAGLLLAGTAAQAQVRFAVGPQVGYTLATADYDYAGYLSGASPYSNGYKSGFAAGITAELGFGHLALQPGIQFVQKGFTLTLTDPASLYPFTAADIRYRHDYLAIPLNVAFTQQANGQGAQVFAGPYLGFLLGGTYTADGTYLSANGPQQTHQSSQVVVGDNYLHSTSAQYDVYARRLDAGLQVGFGYRYQGLLLQATYSHGLRNVGAADPAASISAPTYHNRMFQFSLAYLFGPKS